MQSRNNGSVPCFGSPFLEYSAIIYPFFRFVKTNFRFICQNAHFFTRIAYKNERERKNNEKIRIAKPLFPPRRPLDSAKNLDRNGRGMLQWAYKEFGTERKIEKECSLNDERTEEVLL